MMSLPKGGGWKRSACFVPNILSLGAGWNDNCYVNYSGRARHFADGGIAIIAPISSKQLFVYTAFSFNFLFQVALCRTSPPSFAAN